MGMVGGSRLDEMLPDGLVELLDGYSLLPPNAWMLLRVCAACRVLTRVRCYAFAAACPVLCARAGLSGHVPGVCAGGSWSGW